MQNHHQPKPNFLLMMMMMLMMLMIMVTEARGHERGGKERGGLCSTQM